MVRTIYTDLETENNLKQILEYEPKFNLSKFFKEQLFQHYIKLCKSNLDSNVIQHKLMDLINEEQSIKDKKNYYETQLNEIKQTEFEQSKIDEEKRNKELENLEYKKNFLVDYILESYPNIELKEINILVDTFIDRESKFKGIDDFMKSKDYLPNYNDQDE